MNVTVEQIDSALSSSLKLVTASVIDSLETDAELLALARTALLSDRIKNSAGVAIAMSMVSLMISKQEKPPKDQAEARKRAGEMIQDSEIQKLLVAAFVAGFTIGKQTQ